MSFSHVAEHYRLRRFSRPAVNSLVAEMESRVDGRNLVIDENLRRPLSSLPNAFAPIPHNQLEETQLGAISAVLAFAFGYRLKSRDVPGADCRLPGRNNHALAASVSAIHELIPEVPICTQFEITDALEDIHDLSPAVSTPAEDWGTAKVLEFFQEHVPASALDPGAHVVVIAHGHHYGRCAKLVARAGFCSFLPPKSIPLYFEYDPLEAQPRVMSERLFLRSDFISMCATFAQPGAA